jgi:hypothetical protein
LVPKGTSSAGTTNYLAALLFKSIQKLDFAVVPKAKFKEIGFDARPLAAGPLDDRMRSEIERWAHVIAEAGVEKQ